jgi:hypothetical protein
LIKTRQPFEGRRSDGTVEAALRAIKRLEALPDAREPISPFAAGGNIFALAIAGAACTKDADCQAP